jgi:hypothetical protein
MKTFVRMTHVIVTMLCLLTQGCAFELQAQRGIESIAIKATPTRIANAAR